jgi:hypothetical protein
MTMKGKKSFVIGMKFGRLTVLSDVNSNGKSHRKVLVKCECGNEKEVFLSGIKGVKAKIISCGCFRKEVMIKRKTIHGDCRSQEYAAYSTAYQRCNNEKTRNYKDYGGRGIKFLFKNYQEFITHIGKKPTPNHSLDRIENNGNYQIGNVKWSTLEEQTLNKRHKGKIGMRGIRRISRKNGRFNYSVTISFEGNRKCLGTFPTLIEARKKYLFAYFRLHHDLPLEERGVL